MKKFISMFLLVVMLISLSACGSPANEESEEPTPASVDETIEDDADKDIEEDKDLEEDEDTEIAEEEKDVNIYYTSEEYIMTGNEDLEKLESEKRAVTYGPITLEEAVVRELLKDPENEKLINSIPADVKLIEVKVENDIAYVDFAKDGMEGGSLEEILTIDQIVTSLLDLGTVSKVQFLLDGEVPESLMGHITTTEPFEGRPE